MDNSHVALVALLMRQDGFEHYRCGALPTATVSVYRHRSISRRRVDRAAPASC